MPTFERDPAVDRFLDAATDLDAERWSWLVETAIGTFEEWGEFTDTIQGAVSGSERKALDKHMKEVIRQPLGDLAQANDLRFSTIAGCVRQGIFALQKREKIGVDAVREWWDVQFEPAGIRFDEMIGAD